MITVTGVERAVRTLEKLDMRSKLALFAERLCKEVGEPIIKATHGNHAQVYSEPTPEGYQIVAEGSEVLFIEFGTGNATGDEADKYDEVPVVVRPGSWSEAHQGEYYRTGGYPIGYWHFGNNVFTETPPHPSFYDAYQEMVQAIPRIAKEVFNG